VLKLAEVFPPDRTWEEIEADMMAHLDSGRRLEIDNSGKEMVVFKVPDMKHKQVIVISDWHLGSSVADTKRMDEIRDYILSDPSILVIFAGDEIEGWSGGKHSQSIDSKADLDAAEQIRLMRRRYFAPLAEAGRILGMVSDYWAHPGWLADKTLNVWEHMIGDLDIKLIQNGGHLVMRFPNGYEEVTKVWHNPPRGSNFDEVAGQRNVMLSTSESSRPDGSVAGHIHRMQVAEEMYAGAKYSVFYVSSGTEKGSNPKLATDLFGRQLGLSRAEPGGQGFTVIPPKGRREPMIKTFAALAHAKVANEAIDTLERTEQLGIRDEILEEMRDRSSKKYFVEEAPLISYPAGSNRLGERYKEERPPKNIVSGGETIVNPYSQVEMKSPFSVLAMDIKTKLPVTMELISNAGLGSSVEGFKELRGFVREVALNPHRLVLFLRNMIDKEAGKLPNRIDVLDKFVKLINGETKAESINGQTLAILMCESMRQGDWKKQISLGKDYGNDGKLHTVYDPPVAPGSYMAEQTGIPLIHHLSLLKLAIGPGNGPKTLYPVVTADKAGNFGSNVKPEWGLMRLYDLLIHEKPAAVVGTHLANAGAATIFDPSNAYTNYPVVVAPGWWRKAVDTMGKGNVGVGAEPGQAIIFLPGKFQGEAMMIPTISKEQTEYMHDALMMEKGLELLGIKEWVMKKTK